jgi:3D-(3,5/4)-trihydroxycyclohexane-1,2-dione acylhydrolase (decyclizing)
MDNSKALPSIPTMVVGSAINPTTPGAQEGCPRSWVVGGGRVHARGIADRRALAVGCERAAALDPDERFDISSVPADADVVPDTGAILTQGQVIGLLQEHARAGDTIVAAAGGPPGDLQKVWDATEGRFCHLEFGFSCMGYEIPAGMGIRLAEPDPNKRVVVFIGDGTFLMMPSELVTAAQESLAVTVVIPENRGYQVIHRLQMARHGREFGNEFRYRAGRLDLTGEKPAEQQPRLDGPYLEVDLVEVAHGLGARAIRATTAQEVRGALDGTREHDGPVVIVVPVIPHVDLPGAGAWWDMAPSEVSEDETVQRLRTEYEGGLATQRWWHG